jgi:hypothetical protein
MFLSTGYTLEAFFWIVLIAIALVTLTIFFATPKPTSKKLQDWHVSHLKGTISDVSNANPRGIQKEIQDTSSENIENEIYEEIVENNRSTFDKIKAYAIIFTYTLFFLIVLFIAGLGILFSGSDIYVFLFFCLLFTINIVSFYFFLMGDGRVLDRRYYRILSVLLLFNWRFWDGSALPLMVSLAIFPLIFSKDITSFRKRTRSIFKWIRNKWKSLTIYGRVNHGLLYLFAFLLIFLLLTIILLF